MCLQLLFYDAHCHMLKKLLSRFDIKTHIQTNFYRNQGQSALATQLFFLFQRMQQIQDLKQRSLFENVRVADFLIEKDRLFAEVTLSNEELGLYNKVYEHITIDAPTPDLVIYLQAPIEVLKERITKRGNINEQYLTLDYLEKLNDAY